MKNIQEGDILKLYGDQHRYVVVEPGRLDKAIVAMRSVIDDHEITIDLDVFEYELVEGIERVQRGTRIQSKHGSQAKILEVGFNSFMTDDGNWHTFEDAKAKDWKIVGKEEEEPNTKVICNMCGWTDEGEYFMGAVTGSGAQYGPHKGCSKNGILEEEEPKEAYVKIRYDEDHVLTYGNARWLDLNGTEYSLDYILKAIKAYEEN